MPITRPIVMVYQELATLSVQPGIPDLNTVIVGPAFWIKDYPTDDDDIALDDYVKNTFTKDAACDASGDSKGRPDAGTTFLTLTEPPDFPSGGVLDADSADLVLGTAYIQVHEDTDGDISNPADGLSNVFTTAAGGITASDIAAGDRLVMTKNGTGLLANTVVKIVKGKVTGSDTTFEVTSAFSVAEYTALGGAGGMGVHATSIDFRVEHVLTDQRPDTSVHLSITGNEVLVLTGPTGMWLTYNSTPYIVNYATMYLGYRALRTDLQTVGTISDSDAIETAIGLVDERNPLAAMVSVALANSSNGVKYYGVESDDLAGHTSARDAMSTRDDLYCIVPAFDDVTSADRISILGMWKTYVVAISDPLKSKFRSVIGSYGELPTTKAAVDPSLLGSTVADPAPGALVDVFVDGGVGVDLETKNISDTDVLDIQNATTGAANTLAASETIFDAAYGGPLELLGVMGKKRVRTDGAIGAAIASPGEVVEYAVRPNILSTDPVPQTPVATVAGVTIVDAGGVIVFQKNAAFASVQVGDVIKVTASAPAGIYDLGFLVSARTDNQLTTTITSVAIIGETGNIEIYRPLAYASDATVTGTNTFNKAAAFADVAIGDVVYCLDDDTSGLGLGPNRGMWIVSNVPSANAITVSTHGGVVLTNEGVGVNNVVIFRPQAARGAATIVTRKRLTRLTDATATFITGGVKQGNYIEIPYPADADPLHWDTTTTRWPIDAVVAEQILDADLDDLEELAPKDFVAGFAGDCHYRISIALDKDGQVEELNTIPTGLKDMRIVMAWPNQCTVTGLTNNLTGVQGRHDGQYLAAVIGGMTAGLPSHQGFTFIGASGISRIYNSNLYFSDSQIDDLSEGGWYVFLQDSETSSPYSAHEVTTDTDAYETGEFMHVKNFDFVSIFFKRILQTFVGRYNITNETLKLIRGSLDAGVDTLRGRTFPRIGAPLISGTITSLVQDGSEVDRVKCYMDIELPAVLNKIELHLVA